MTDNEEPRSTSPSPLELQEVDQIKKKEEEEVHSHEPSFEGSLKMSEMNIHWYQILGIKFFLESFFIRGAILP